MRGIPEPRDPQRSASRLYPPRLEIATAAGTRSSRDAAPGRNSSRGPIPMAPFFCAPVSKGIPLSQRNRISYVARAFSDPGRRPRLRATTNFSSVGWTRYPARSSERPAKKKPFQGPRRLKRINDRRLISLFRLLHLARDHATSDSLQISQGRGCSRIPSEAASRNPSGRAALRFPSFLQNGY